MKWPTSPAHVCDVIVAVPTQHDKQAVYKKGEFDDDDVTEHDMSGHDEAHTAKLVEVVLPVLMSFVATHCFVFQCASGGCVTAVSTARAMRAAGVFNNGSISAGVGVPLFVEVLGDAERVCSRPQGV